MVVFLRYLFNESYLKEAVRDDWLKLYDKQYVDETIERILSWKPDVDGLLESLEETVYLTRKKVSGMPVALLLFAHISRFTPCPPGSTLLHRAMTRKLALVGSRVQEAAGSSPQLSSSRSTYHSHVLSPSLWRILPRRPSITSLLPSLKMGRRKKRWRFGCVSLHTVVVVHTYVDTAHLFFGDLVSCLPY